MKTMLIVFLLGTMTGCRTVTPETGGDAPLRFEYSIVGGSTGTVTVTHYLVNTSDRPVWFCSLPEGMCRDWCGHRPGQPFAMTDDDPPVPLLLDHDRSSGRTAGGRFGMIETRDFYACLASGQRFLFSTCQETVPMTCTSITYRAWKDDFRDGSRFGLVTWTNHVEGPTVTVPLNWK